MACYQERCPHCGRIPPGRKAKQPSGLRRLVGRRLSGRKSGNRKQRNWAAGNGESFAGKHGETVGHEEGRFVEDSIV